MNIFFLFSYSIKNVILLPHNKNTSFHTNMSKKLITAFAISTMYCINAQTKAEEAIKTLEQKYPQEKIHLLLNKKSFVAGDNLWFKAFVFDGYTTTNTSSSLFIELYDKNKTQISKKLFPLINGEGNGSISLPDSLKEDVYYIRAYTTWMANFSEDFQLVKPIPIYNPTSPEKLIVNGDSHWTASVHPESGSFIDGINTKFAVRLQSNGEAPSKWEGYITDTDNPNVKISTFKGLDQNVGLFNLTPKIGKKYQLIVQDSQGQTQNISLPDVSPSGINLQVTSDKNQLTYSLKSKNLPEGSKYFKIIGTMANQLVYKAKISKISNDAQYPISYNQLVNGILQLTVFDDKENIIASRLSFVQPHSLQVKKPALESLSLNSTPRGKSSFDISKNLNHPNYTVLITEAEASNTEEDQNLLSSFWLTGDITSKISKPAQYFSPQCNTDALDALLISEKWKRFDWQSIMSGKYPVIKYEPQNFLSYKGKINVQGKPSPNTDLNLIFDTNSGPQIFQIKSDSNGFFTLNNLLFEDSMKFSYQLNTKQPDPNYTVFFQPSYEFIPYQKSLPLTSYQLTPRSANEQPSNEVARAVTALNTQKAISDKVINITEVKLKGELKDKTKKLNKQLSSSLFTSINESVFDFVNNPNLQGSTNILQWLQGKVAGLNVQFQNGDYIPYIRGSVAGVFLDEVNVDPGQISSLPMSEIAMVKVSKGSIVGVFGGELGIIAIYTKRNGPSGKTIDKSLPSQLRKITLNGYNKEIPFDNPIYENDSFKSIPQDTRSILYWNPFLEDQSPEPSHIQFYNNDDAKKYKIIIMGYDKNNETPLYYNEILP